MGTYWEESRRPLAAFLFVVPMIAIYEAGLLALGPGAMRNGVDVWLRCLLQQLGFGQYFLLPVLTCGILLGWHHVRRERWRIASGVLYGMTLESIAWAWLLVALAFLEGHLADGWTTYLGCAVAAERGPGGPVQAAAGLLPFFGAGIYEELLFRLIFLPTAILLLQHFGVASHAARVAMAVLATSLLFAAVHYRIDISLGSWHLATRFGDTFAWPSFLFRAFAGSFFSVLFLYRGFGIAAGAHAIYDIFVYLL